MKQPDIKKWIIMFCGWKGKKSVLSADLKSTNWASLGTEKIQYPNVLSEKKNNLSSCLIMLLKIRNFTEVEMTADWSAIIIWAKCYPIWIKKISPQCVNWCISFSMRSVHWINKMVN